jgi:cytochrome c-type biogenesis protein CcmH
MVAAAAVAVTAAALIASTGGGATDSIGERAKLVASGLRCPVCQNLSVADSPSRLAGEMRAEIAERLAAGATDDEVRDFFVARYGEWVLLEPTREGLNLLPWLFPLAAVVVGAGLWLAVVRHPPGRVAEPVTQDERRRIDRELAALEDVP